MWSLKFGPDSVTLTVKDLVQGMTISSQEILLVAWSLLSQRQDFLNNHLVRVSITPNQEGTMEMRDEMLSSIGPQDMDTSGYQVSDVDDVEFYKENDQLDVDAVFGPDIDTLFSPSTFNDVEKGSTGENPILIDKEQDKVNSAPPTHPTAPVSVITTQPLVLMRVPNRNTNSECSQSCIQKFVWII